MEDEYPFYIFLFLPWKKMLSVKISFVFHGRRTFLSHFLSSSMEDELSLYILLSSEPSDECSSLFSVNPIALETQFFLFFSIGLISNSHRVEAARTSSSWKSASHAAGQDRMEAAHALHARASQDNDSEFAERLYAGWHWIVPG